MNGIEKLILQMIEFDSGDAMRIQHFIKVYEFSHLIGVAEEIPEETQYILDAAAILHDIGIVPCEKKFGHCNGKMQEEYGPDYARDLIKANGGFDIDEEERICYLIGHHHTLDAIDGIDYQILVESDFLVNAYEEEISPEAIKNTREKIFRTETGIKLLDQMFS